MYVIAVMPLARGIPVDTLSYFSSEDYPVGTFLLVPIRGKQQRAIVLHTKDASTTKTALKAATFSLRKLPAQSNTSILPTALRNCVEDLYERLPFTRGALFYQLLPAEIRDGRHAPPQHTPRDNITSTPEPPTVLHAPRRERYTTYQREVRSAFAHRGSVLFVVPVAADVAKAYEALGRGITDRVVCFSSGQTTKERTQAHEALQDLSTTKLIITTPSHAYLHRPDVTHVIIEHIGSSHFVTRDRPFLDHREALQLLAKHAGWQVLLGDTLPTTETEYSRRTEKLSTSGEPARRLSLPAPLQIEMQEDTGVSDTPFQLFSEKLAKRINTTLEARRNVFLFAGRRGLAPVVACYDCGYIFRCPDSGAPYSLVRTYDKDETERRWFVSPVAGTRVRAADTCPNCGSWRLRERGIGIQYMYDECQQWFPDTPVYLFDQQTITTRKKAQTAIKKFTRERGAILLGTQMTIPYLPSVSLAAIPSLDALRSIPSWRADETLLRLLFELRETAEHEVYVQTRQEPDDLLRYAKQGAVKKFYDEELALREMLSYPPFATFYLLTWRPNSSPDEIEATIKHTLPATVNSRAEFYASPTTPETPSLRHCLLRLTSDTSEMVAVVTALRSLPPYVRIMRNPDRIV